MPPFNIPPINRAADRASGWLWQPESAAKPWWERSLLMVARVAYALLRDLLEGQLTLRAMSLVYTTLLSFVPLLAISFSVLKGFGAHNQIEPFLLNFLAPLGDKSVEITNQVIEFVDNTKVGVLGVIGFVLLFYTVVSLMQKIERAFNFVWRVHQERSFSQRFRDYLSVLVIGPVLIFSALGITASLTSAELVQGVASVRPVGAAIEFFGRLVPYLLIVVAFTFIYMFMPNTKVRLRSAFIGALAAGILWNSLGWIFAAFVVGSANYAAIYSTFATLVVFLIWLYLAWLILLAGASISFYHQHPEYLRARQRELRLSNRVRVQLALLTMLQIARSFAGPGGARSEEDICQAMNLPSEAIGGIVDALEYKGLIVKNAEEPPGYMPSRPLERIAVAEVLEAARGGGRPGDGDMIIGTEMLPNDPAISGVIADIDLALAEVLQGRSVQDLLDGKLHEK
ncbi:MAG: YihY/virulence factor BrkB family protein [Rhodovibrionaceae bacterium]